MSGFALLFSRDGAPVEPEVVDRLMAAIDHRGPDGSRVVHLPSVSLAHQHFWTTPEEVGERQPLALPETQLHLVFDGRIDNRGELLAALDRRGEEGRSLSDAFLVLRAYERWREAAFARILGPFAAAVHDAVLDRLVLARDALGDRTLFFHLDERLLVVGSEACAVLAHPAMSHRLDERRLAIHFALQEPVDGTTFFADVQELLPAHLMVVTRDSATTSCYWSPDPKARLPHLSDEEYADRLRSVLEESVACRLRSVGPPAVMMSGGLDSTSIAAVAARQLAAGQAPGRLKTFSWVFDELEGCDERRYIDAMCNAYDLESIRLACDDAWPFGDLNSWPVNPNAPEGNLYRRLLPRIYGAACDSGVRTLLSGLFGDQLYSGGERRWLWDLVEDRRWDQVLSDARWHIADQGPWGFFRRSVVSPIVPSWLRRLLRPRRQPRWLTKRAKELLSGLETTAFGAKTPRRLNQFRHVLGLFTAYCASSESHHASRACVELRYPFRDRRLVELMLALPAHQAYTRGVRRTVLRNAMREILPEAVRLRKAKTSLEALYRRGIDEQYRSFVERQLMGSGDGLWRRFVRAEWLAEAPPGSRQTEIEEVVLALCSCCELWRRAWQSRGVPLGVR